MFSRLSRVFDFDMGSGLSQSPGEESKLDSATQGDIEHGRLADKECQTDVTLMEMCYDVVELVGNDNRGKTSTSDSVKITNNQECTQENTQMDAMQTEIDFLKNELITKQNTIENLLQLLQSNMEMTKNMSQEKRRYGSDMCFSDDATLVSESNSNRNSQIIHDWQMNAQLQFHELTLCHEEEDDDSVDGGGNDEFQDSLNSNNLTSSMSAHSEFDVFIDSLEVLS